MKRFLFVQDKPPHGTVLAQEGLDAILMGSAFVQCTVLLLEDGLYQVLSGQQTEALGTKHYAVTYQALSDYGVQNIFCSASHLEQRGLDTSDFVVPVQALSDTEIIDLFTNHDVILSF